MSAEVVLKGSPWAVLRPLGVGRGHFAVQGVLPEQLFERLNEPTGMAPLIDAIEQQVITKKVTALMPVDQLHDAWRVALAWLTRDQECRFDHVLDWRAAESNSESPTRSMSRGRLQDAMRALIAAISPDEMQLQAEANAQGEELKTRQNEAARWHWSCEHLRTDVLRSLELPPTAVPEGRLGLEALRHAARQKLAQAAKTDDSVDVSNLDALRQRAREAAKVVTDLEQKLAVANSSLPLHEKLLKTLQAELPASSVRVRDAEVPACQICEVPIDRALAEGCKLSHKLPDLDGLRQRYEALQKQIDEKKTEVESTRTDVITVNRQLPSARTERDTLQQALKKAERLSDSRSTAWSQGKKNLDDIQRLERDWASWELAQEKVAKLQEQIETKRERLGAYRDQQVEVFTRLSIFFNAIIRAAVGPTASGKVTLDGNGMKLAVQLGGERSTAAIESLKVIAFDLAVMCMSMQGTTRLPAFLLHDSPREADLGLSVYHRLFDVVNGLEGTTTSAFQYIVTTTTQPPPAFQQPPWLREVLRGAPPQERLLRCDLP
ncbi:chromosome segregation protein SMC [Acidovorax sp.]|uniref:chromosome segregation protein SMC n=1 Tax=Acidovorax sp. TaxID=1872122 RepID=UPI0025C2D1C2|nr:chromosome segregation protein SMC [Acidovorax sp.]MBW8464614.1 chromosome segregation protein SMC [Acidovorax sp.]